MKRSTSLQSCTLAALFAASAPSAALAQAVPCAVPSSSAARPAVATQLDPTQVPEFTYREVMVPMRDGKKLQTVILTPINQKGPLPILMSRTPYGVPRDVPTPAQFERFKELAADGYILVFQSIRGRFKSEGEFDLSEDFRVDPGRGTIETRDAWDSIDWLVRNVPSNNGRVGIFGVSYDGYTAAATLLDPHPALKAVSEQAAPADEWMNDDSHRYGALRLSYAFEYAVLEEADRNRNTNFSFDKWDSYEWYLGVGPLSAINARYLHGRIESWNAAVAHPDYDAHWKSQAWVQALHRSSVPNLNVAGFWDQEDPWGPWQIFRHASEHDPDRTNLIVAGPWRHGGWNGAAMNLGPVDLGQDTGRYFREKIQAPFFAYWLKGEGSKPQWQVTTFQTGSNEWRQYATWPPKASHATSLYLHADGSLSFIAPGHGQKGAHRDYVSDPANPVPYRQRPISPTYPGGDWPTWESDDQRFVDHRPDVLSFTSAPLDHDLVVTGDITARLFVSSSGTDSDFVVKLIDVFPDDAKAPDWPEDVGPRPGEFMQAVNGYEMPIAMEVKRGRYLKSFEHASALVANKPTAWQIPLRDRDHVFRKGHRIMVQIQSTWFPLIDRNPQTFVPSIYLAKASDFVAAKQRVFTSPEFPSRIVLPVTLSN